jgi:hypothetical protein
MAIAAETGRMTCGLKYQTSGAMRELLVTSPLRHCRRLMAFPVFRVVFRDREGCTAARSGRF